MKISVDGIEVIVEEAEGYLQINDICGADLDRIWGQVKAEYAACEKFLCYHNMEPPKAALEKLGAVLWDDSIEMRLAGEGFTCLDTPGVVGVTEETFDEFAAYHDSRNPDMYWTSGRIRRDLANWGIFTVRRENQIAAYTLVAMWPLALSEIFCVEGEELSQCEALLAAAIRFSLENGKREVLYMADTDTLGKKAAENLGFTATGFYKGYRLERE